MPHNTSTLSDTQQLTTTLALVDDHTLFREGLARVIDEFDNYKVVLKAGNGEELINQLNPESLPDIVLLDLNMPVRDGYETARWLIANHPEVKIVILTMFDSELALIRLLRLGVKSFIKKDTHPDQLKYALETIIKVGYYSTIPTYINGTFPSLLLKHSKKPLKLSDNETIFMKLATTDLTYKEIAKEMCVSDRTLENYWGSLKDKLSVKSRIGLAMYAVKNGLGNI